jgi:hypothetical protein
MWRGTLTAKHDAKMRAEGREEEHQKDKVEVKHKDKGKNKKPKKDQTNLDGNKKAYSAELIMLQLDRQGKPNRKLR